MNLVRAVIEPRPAPVIVEKNPEFSYIYYAGEYIPYYDGWLYVDDVWLWAGTGYRPPKPPRWTPPPRPRHQAPPRHKVIVLPEHRPGHGPGHGPAADFRREERRPEPPRTVVVRPERKDPAARPEPPRTVVVRPERKDPAVRPEHKEKEKVTVVPDRRHDTPPKKDR